MPQTKAVLGKGFPCHLCHKEYGDQIELNKHIKRHRRHQYECDTCGEKVKTQELLKEHKKTHQKPDNKPHKCNLCNKGYATAKSLGQHKRTVHGEGPKKPKHLCSYPLCKKPFDSPFLRKAHEESHKKGTILPDGSLATKANKQSTASSSSAPRPTGDATDHVSSDDDNHGDGNGNGSGESSAPEDDPKLTKLKTLAPNAAKAFKQRRATIHGIMSAQLTASDPGTPNTMQQLYMGNNLRAFEAAQLVDPLPKLVDPTLQPSKNLRHLLQQPARREIGADLVPSDDYTGQIDAIYFDDRSVPIEEPVTKSSSPIDKPVTKRSGPIDEPVTESSGLIDELVMDISALRAPEATAKVLAKYLTALLARVPVLLKELSTNHKQWLLAASRRLAFDADSSIKMKVPAPRPVQHKGNMVHVVEISGYDHVNAQSWTTSIEVPVGGFDKTKPVDIPDELRYVYSVDHPLPSPLPNGITAGDVQYSRRLSRMILTKSLAFIGPYEVFEQESSYVLHSYLQGMTDGAHKSWVQRRRAEAGNKSWDRSAFWIRKEESHNTVFFPTQWMRATMKGRVNTIIMYGIEPENAYHVANSMLRSMERDGDADIAWGIGCAVADAESSSMAEGNMALPIPKIPADSDPYSLQVCPGCHQVVVLSNLTPMDVIEYAVCSSCNKDLEPPSKGQNLKHGAVGEHLFSHIIKDNKVARKPKTKEQIVLLCNNILDNLPNKISDTQWYCAYADQVLDVTGSKSRCWDGSLYNPFYPSVDAIDCVVVGSDGLTHYHEPGNITVCSDSLNRSIRQYPKVMFNGLLQTWEATEDQDEQSSKGKYERAIALSRNCQVNHAEYGELAHIHQTTRLAKQPPGNMAAIAQSFRTGERLPRTVSNHHVWRTNKNDHIGTADTRSQWEPEWKDWMLQQIDMIGLEVFHTQEMADKYRKYWIRNGIPHPFSQYAVFTEYNWWILMTIMTIKTKRNIEHCQRPHAHIEEIPVYSAVELLLTVMNIWIRMVKADVDLNRHGYDLGRDECRQIPHGNINNLFCASLGHKDPGKSEHTGLSGFDLNSSAAVSFDPNVCGMMWETQFTNYLKFKYNLSTLDDVFEQIGKIRRANLVPGQKNPILPVRDTDFKLIDELKDGPVVNAPPTVSQSMPMLNAETAKALEKAIEVETTAVSRTQSPTFEDEDVFDDLDMDQLLDADAPEATNMSNAGCTCYMSAVLQVMAQVPDLRKLVGADGSFNSPTGRDPGYLARLGDPDGAKHTSLRSTLNNLFGLLNIRGRRLPVGFTEAVVDTASKLTTQFRKDVMNDAATFYGFIMDCIDCVSDRSLPIRGAPVFEKLDRGGHKRRPPYRPAELLIQEASAELVEGKPARSLSSQAAKHLTAFYQSGHMSEACQNAMLQYVESYPCSSGKCPVVKRDFLVSSQLLLEFPHSTPFSKDVPLATLTRHKFKEVLDPKFQKISACVNHNLHGTGLASSSGQYNIRYAQVTCVPEVFAVEIGRTRVPRIKLDDDSDQATLQEKLLWCDKNPFTNRVTDYHRINMADWSTNAPQPPRKPLVPFDSSTQTEHPDRSLQAEYEVIAIVAYSYETKHYVSFVRLRDRWALFDDLDSLPQWRDPVKDWPETFVETILWYRRIGDLPVPAAEDIAESSDDGDAMQGIEVNDSTRIRDVDGDDKMTETLHNVNEERRGLHEQLEKAQKDNKALGKDVEKLQKRYAQMKQSRDVLSRRNQELEAEREADASADPFEKLAKALDNIPDSDALGVHHLVYEKMKKHYGTKSRARKDVLKDDAEVLTTPSRKPSMFQNMFRKVTGADKRDKDKAKVVPSQGGAQRKSTTSGAGWLGAPHIQPPHVRPGTPKSVTSTGSVVHNARPRQAGSNYAPSEVSRKSADSATMRTPPRNAEDAAAAAKEGSSSANLKDRNRSTYLFGLNVVKPRDRDKGGRKTPVGSLTNGEGNGSGPPTPSRPRPPLIDRMSDPRRDQHLASARTPTTAIRSGQPQDTAATPTPATRLPQAHSTIATISDSEEESDPVRGPGRRPRATGSHDTDDDDDDDSEGRISGRGTSASQFMGAAGDEGDEYRGHGTGASSTARRSPESREPSSAAAASPQVQAAAGGLTRSRGHRNLTSWMKRDKRDKRKDHDGGESSSESRKKGKKG